MSLTFRWERLGMSGLDGGSYSLAGHTLAEFVPRDEASSITGGMIADGEKAVAYTEIVPVLIEAVKAQQREIMAQQGAIKALEDRIAELESQAAVR
jgi:hypothetical protein